MGRTDDLVAITEVIDSYAIGVDRRDWEMVRACFTADCRADYGRAGSWSSRESLVAALDDMHRDVGPTLHRMSNHHVDLQGTTASATSYLDALLRVEHRGFDLLHVAAVYHDELCAGPGGWAISCRRVENFLWRREHSGS